MKTSCIMSISRILTNLCAIRQKLRIKNIFADIVYNSLVVKKLQEHKKVCFKINGKQSVKLTRSSNLKIISNN